VEPQVSGRAQRLLLGAVDQADDLFGNDLLANPTANANCSCVRSGASAFACLRLQC